MVRRGVLLKRVSSALSQPLKAIPDRKRKERGERVVADQSLAINDDARGLWLVSREPNHRPMPSETSIRPTFDRIALHRMADLPLAIITKYMSNFFLFVGESSCTIFQVDDGILVRFSLVDSR